MAKYLVAIIFFISSFCFSQDYYNKEDAHNNKRDSVRKKSVTPSELDTFPEFYFGIGAGLNNYNGLFGIGAKYRIHKTFFLRAGAGIGSWGSKLSIGVIYERKHASCWSYGIGYSSCSGLRNFKTQLETVASAPNTEEVTIDLLRASTVNLTTSYNWYFRRKKIFYLEFGLAVAVESEPYSVKSASVLTDNSKRALRLLQPGGLIFGLGFMF